MSDWTTKEASVMHRLDCGEEVAVYYRMEMFFEDPSDLYPKAPICTDCEIEILFVELPDGTAIDPKAISDRNIVKIAQTIESAG